MCLLIKRYSRNLLNCFKTILIRLGVMEDYPSSILPYKGWTNNLDANKIKEHNPDSLIGRWFTGKLEEYTEIGVDGSPVVKEGWLDTGDIPGLSTSLLNTRFQYECFNFRQIGKGKQTWNGSNIRLADFTKETDYTTIGEYCVIGWRVADLHAMTIPYTKEFPKEKDYNAFVQNVRKNNSDISDSEEIERICSLCFTELAPSKDAKTRELNTRGSISVTHAPNNLNYWHFTIDYYTIDNKTKSVSSAKRRWQELMALSVMNILKNTFIEITPGHSAFGFDYTPLLA